MAAGARAQGLRNLIVTAKGRERTYAEHYRRREAPARGCVDAVLELDAFPDILGETFSAGCCRENVIFVPNRSFEVYLHQRYSYDEIERGMLVPFFGNRGLLRAEERDEGRNQYDLMERAGIRYPNASRRRRQSTGW